MQSKIILWVFTLHAVYAWLSPERCKQEKFLSASTDLSSDSNFSVPIAQNITEIAATQHQNLVEEYKDAKFFGVPTMGLLDRAEYDGEYKMYAPNSCSFHTYKPSLLASINCQDGVTCKLIHTISTTKSYTAAEGYNWGVKVSTKVKILEVWEVGGEASGGGTYTCTFTEGRTTTTAADCSASDVTGKTLRLFNVQSDMECQFSTITMIADKRNNGTDRTYAPRNSFSYEEATMVQNSGILKSSYKPLVLMDVDRISDELMFKINRAFPHYNPYTDPINLWYDPYVLHFKESSVKPGPKRIIPFTKEDGNSVYQYACTLS